jgi:hypothetical protein
VLNAGQLLAPLATLKVTRAGSEPREVTEVAVKPTGLPSELFSVITHTPEAWRLKDCLRASVVSVSFSMTALSFLASRLT